MVSKVTQLLGRRAELGALEAVLRAGVGEESSAAAIVGDPGIGKSTLLAEALPRVTDRRTVIAHGRASEFERQLPFGVFIDALDAYLGSLGPRGLSPLGESRVAVVGRIFPALEQLEAPESARPEASQLHGAVRALLALLASERRLVLVLDDLHWADQASIELVANLLHRRVDGTTLLVAYRPAQASRLLRHAVDAACERESCTEIPLWPLSREDAEGLLVGASEPDSIYRESGGNPFYLKQLVRASTGDPSATEAYLQGVPVTVMRALGSELAELPESTRLVVDAASVAGEPVEPDLVSAIASMERTDVLDGLDDALGRGLMVTTAVPGRFEFRHPIVRRAVYASAPAAWLVGGHDRATRALAAAGARPSLLAHHVELSARQGDEAAVGVLTDAGREAARVAPASAARWYAAALRLLPANAAADRRLALLAPLAASLTAAGQLIRAREVLEEVLGLLPPEAGALWARPLIAIALIERVLGQSGPGRELLATALGESSERSSSTVAALELELAADRYFEGDWSQMQFHAQSALAGSRQFANASLTAAATAVLGLAEINLGQAPAAGQRVTEAAALLDSIPDRELRAHLGAVHWVGWCEHHLERYGDVRRHYERGLALGQATGQRHLLTPTLLGMVITRTWLGELDAATEDMEVAIQTAQLVGADELIGLTFALRCWLAVRTGDLPAAIATASTCPATRPDANGPHALLTHIWLGEAQIENGGPAAGRDAILAAGGGPELVAIEPCQRAYFAELLTRAALALDGRDEAERWAGLADGSAKGLDLDGPRMWALRARAEILLAAGSPAAAAEVALGAVAVAGSTHPLECERSRLLAGCALAAAGDGAGIELLREAHARLRDFGAHRLEAIAARALRAQGAHVSQTRRPRRGEGVLSDLSGRELEVAELVAEHLTNREIAERLVLSSKTVEHHVEHIFEKLGVGSRGELARVVLSAKLNRSAEAK